MNIVFWALIIIILIGIWFALVPYFRNIGETVSDKITEVKEEMTEEDESEDINEN